MAAILEIKERLKVIYGKYEIYIVPFLKFLLAVVTFSLVNKNLGYMQKLNNPAISIIAALVCSFMPSNMIIVLAAVFVVLHLYALSIECALVVLVLFVLLLLLYFRFSPGDALAVLLTPITFMFNIPYLMPVVYGFIGTPLSAVSVSCGVIVYYVLHYIKLNDTTLGNLDAESAVSRFKFIVDNILANKAMILFIVAFTITLVVVYIIRRLSVDHSWTAALITGTVADMVIVLAGSAVMDTSITAGSVLIGSLASAVIAMCIEFFVFSVDYSRTEHVQFEDDEYYYYVKAVPKMNVSTADKKVKHIQPKASAKNKGK